VEMLGTLEGGAGLSNTQGRKAWGCLQEGFFGEDVFSHDTTQTGNKGRCFSQKKTTGVAGCEGGGGCVGESREICMSTGLGESF
jgi:hypothetical protein